MKPFFLHIKRKQYVESWFVEPPLTAWFGVCRTVLAVDWDGSDVPNKIPVRMGRERRKEMKREGEGRRGREGLQNGFCRPSDQNSGRKLEGLHPPD